MSEISEKMKAVRKKRSELSFQLPDFRFRVQTAYRIPLALRRALERLKDQSDNKSLSELVGDAIRAKCEAEGLQVRCCDKLQRKDKNKVYCELRGETHVENCIKCSLPYDR